MNKIIPLASDACNKWLNENLKELLLEIMSLKDDLSLVKLQESLNLAKKAKIQSLILRTFQSLSDSFNPQTMQKEFFQFLNQIGQSYYFPSQGYYFNLEILRLNFTNFASLGDTNKQQQRMVVILFVFLRNLVFTIFMNAGHNKQDQSDNTLSLVQRNFLIISSIIHEIIVQWIGKTVIKINSLDQLIEEKNKVIPRIGPLTNLAKEVKVQYKDDILIENLLPTSETKNYIFSKLKVFSKFQLKVREQWVVQLMVLIVELTDKILLQCKLVIDKERKSSNKERMKVKMFFVDSIPKAIIQKMNKK